MADKKTTKELLDKIEKLFEEYTTEDIDTEMLKIEVGDMIDNYS